jgi:hypothetical protein
MTARLWLQQCEAARGIEAQFGVQPALIYLVGEKFLDFLEASDEHATLRADLPAFVAEIKSIFEPWQLASYLETARETEPFDPSIYDDEETVEMERKSDLLVTERLGTEPASLISSTTAVPSAMASAART